MEFINSQKLQTEYPFKHHFIATERGKMHYVDEGEGEPILALHGNPTWSFLYRNFIKGLSGTHRVIAPDLIGFGLSEKPSNIDSYSLEAYIQEIEKLVIDLDLHNIHLMVHDWGGPIGLAMAARHPDRIKSLVVMNSFGFYPPDPSMDENKVQLPFALSMLRMPVIGHLMVRQMGMFEKRVMPMATYRKDRFNKVKHAYQKVFTGAKDRAAVLAFPKLLPTSLSQPSAQIIRNEAEPFLEQFKGPVLLIWGKKDPFMISEIFSTWQKRIPHAQVVEVEDASHYLQEDAHEIVIPKIKTFLLRLNHSENAKAGILRN